MIPPQDSRVLLYSGGLDSYCLAWGWAQERPPDLCLYVDTRSVYADKERAYLAPPPWNIPVAVDTRLTLADCERPDGIVPNRNSFLVLVAAYYGTHISLAATAGDRSADKTVWWARDCTALLNRAFGVQHWCPDGRTFTVELPGCLFTKTQLVAGYLAAGGPPAALLSTVSCYHPTLLHCGQCKACVRRWVALQLNGLGPASQGQYAVSPRPIVAAAVAAQAVGRGVTEDDEWRRALECAL